MCRTCRERPASTLGECRACYQYRRIHGRQRPWRLIQRHLERRAVGGSPARPQGFPPSSELLVTIRDVGRIVPGSPEVCAACGTAAAWIAGRPIPLCVRHRGYLTVIGLMLDTADDHERLLALLTA